MRRRSRDVEYRFVGDTTTRTLSLLNGEADIIERLEQEQVETIAKDARFQHPQGGIGREQVPVLPLLQEAVRRSAGFVWRPAMRSTASRSWKSSACPARRRRRTSRRSSSATPTLPEYPEFDPAKAQKLLAEAGFPKGEGLPELTYYTSVGFYPKTKEYGELIAGMLQEQGFKVNLQTLEVAAWGNLLYDKPGGGEGHMIDCGWCTGSPEPDLVLRTHFHSSSKRICGIVDTEIDAVLDKERNAADARGAQESPADRNAADHRRARRRRWRCSRRCSSTPTARSWTVSTSTRTDMQDLTKATLA